MTLTRPTTFNIHGSCVSSDIFRFAKTGELEIGKYVSRTSFISAMSPPVMFGKEESLPVPLEYRRHLVYVDLAKRLEADLSAKADYLIIDFTDERWDLLKMNSAYATCSPEFADSPVRRLYRGEIVRKENVQPEVVDKAMEAYCRLILKLYNSSRIIIHRAYPSDRYVEDGITRTFGEEITADNARMRVLLDNYYGKMQEGTGAAHVIDLGSKYSAARAHFWGFSAYHYEDGYYQEALKALESLCAGSE